MKFRSDSKSAENLFYSQSHPRRVPSVSTLSSDSAGDDNMQNENVHSDAHGDRPAPSSYGNDVQNGKSKKNIQPMTAIKIVNKSLRKKSGKLSENIHGTVKQTWCRSLHRKEGIMETQRYIAGTERDRKLTPLPLAGKQELLSVLANDQSWSDKLKRDACKVEVGNMSTGSSFGSSVFLNMTKGYLV
jgi:hypothetical protein